MSLRNSILTAKDYTVEPVEVPEWGLTVFVRSVDGHGRAALVKLIRQAQTAGGTEADFLTILPEIVRVVACDEGGNLIFTAEDAEALGGKSPQALDRVALAGLRVNGLHGSAVDEQKKSSGSTPT